MHNILYLPTSNEIVDVVKALGDEIVGYSKQKSTTHNRIVPLKLAFKGANTRRTRKPPRSIVTYVRTRLLTFNAADAALNGFYFIAC